MQMLKRVQRPRSENNKYKQLLITLNWHCVPTPINTKAIFCLHFKLHEEVKLPSVATKNTRILYAGVVHSHRFHFHTQFFHPFVLNTRAFSWCKQRSVADQLLRNQHGRRRCVFSSIFCRRLCELRKRQRRPGTSGATEDISDKCEPARAALASAHHSTGPAASVIGPYRCKREVRLLVVD